MRLPGAFCSLHSGGFGRKLGTLSGTENRRNPCFSSKRLQIIHTQLIISQKCSGILILAKGSPSPMRFLPPKTHSKNPRPMAGDFCQLVKKVFSTSCCKFFCAFQVQKTYHQLTRAGTVLTGRNVPIPRQAPWQYGSVLCGSFLA